MSKDEYRLPKVAVIGGGAAGAATAAECKLIGFDVILIDEGAELGGIYAGDNPATPPKKFGFRKNNLRHTKVEAGSSQSAREHIQAAVAYAGPEVRLNTRAESASFDIPSSQWQIQLISNDGVETLSADVLVIATGTGTLNEIVDGNGRAFDIKKTHPHQGVEPMGIPNILVVDGPEPPMTSIFDRPLDVVEARADHTQRYVRQLEIKGPCALEVNKSLWSAAQSTRKKTIADLHDFSFAMHKFIYPNQQQTTKNASRRTSQANAAKHQRDDSTESSASS